MRRFRFWPTALAALVVAIAQSAAHAVCAGDCPPPDGAVRVNELVIGVNVALGRTSLDACASFDANNDGQVSVSELITAVNNAQRGCPGDATPTGDATATGETTPTATPLVVAGTPTDTTTPTVTATPALGPTIVFFGVTSADDTLQMPTTTDPSGIPIYQRNFGVGFSLIVEAQPGVTRAAVALNTFTPGSAPDLWVQATRALGNGSAAVCDAEPPNFGGVPAIDPPDLESPSVDVLNDFACRFIDGAGGTVGRHCNQGCVRFDSGESGCESGDGANLVQFCGQINTAIEFPSGDTLVTVRVRDTNGNLGDPAQLIVRVAE